MTSPKRRRHPGRRHGVGAFTICVLLIASGCSSGGTTGSPIESSPIVSTTSSVASPAPSQSAGANGASGEAADATTLAALYSLLDVQTPAESVLFFATNVPESDVTTCMSAAGFEYVQGPSPEAQVAADLRVTLPPEEFAVRYGFGAAASELGLFPGPPPDPNQAYRLTLTKGEADAYNQVYFRCRGATPDRIAHSNALNTAVAEFRKVIDADDRVMAAVAAWSACLAAAGFTYDTPLSMRESFYLRMNSGISHDELEKLYTEEVAVATANVPCETARRAAYRAVVLERFGEYTTLLAAATASGATPDAQG